jgi:hypothetical protein
MKTLLCLILVPVFIGIALASEAQSLSPFVVSTSGGFYSNGTAQLSFTTGEMTMVQTFTAGSNILTQGFQQPFDFGVFIAEHENFPFSFEVFPNPGSGNFNLAIESKNAVHADVIVYDAIGKVILKKQFALNSGSQILPLSLLEYSEGMYHLEFVTTDNLNGNQQRLSRKIQLIK